MPILEGLYPEREPKKGLKPSIPPLASAEPASGNGSAGSAAPFTPLAPLVPEAPAGSVAEVSVTLPGATDPMKLAQAAAAAAAAASAAAAAATAAAQAASSAAAAAMAAKDQWTSFLASRTTLAAAPEPLAAAPEPAALPPARLMGAPAVTPPEPEVMRPEAQPGPIAVEPAPRIATVDEAPSPEPVKAAPIMEAAPIAQAASVAERIEEPPSRPPTAMVEDAVRPHPVSAVQAAPAPQPAARPQVRIDYIRVSNLTAFARAASADPQRYSVLPIAPRRAEAQALNPLADPDDIGLIVGYVGDRCAGYLGLLPGAVEFRGRRHPVSCLSGFYVAPGDRTSGLVTNLPVAAMNLGRDLYVTRINKEARDLFTQLGFWPAQPQRILRLRLSKFKRLKGIPLRALVRSASGGTDVQNTWQLVTEARNPMTAVWVDEVPRIAARAAAVTAAAGAQGSGETAGFAGLGAAAAALAPSERPRFVRDEGVINWMVRHPWIGEDSSTSLPYALPYRREMFRYMVFEANRGGYVVLNVTQDQRSTTLRILDRRPMTPETRGPALARALVEAQSIGADVIECPAEYEPLLRSTFAGRVLMAADERGALVYTRDQNGPFGKYLDAVDWSGFEGDTPYY